MNLLAMDDTAAKFLLAGHRDGGDGVAAVGTAVCGGIR